LTLVYLPIPMQNYKINIRYAMRILVVFEQNTYLQKD
jgi:hypothetical protein